MALVNGDVIDDFLKLGIAKGAFPLIFKPKRIEPFESRFLLKV